LPDGLNRRLTSLGSTAGIAVPLALAAAVFWIAYDDGSYGLTNRGSIAVIVLWALALAVSGSLWPRNRIPLAALVTCALLVSFAAWTGLSGFWAASGEKAFNEFDRVILYVGVLALAVVAVPRGGARRWLGGLTLGLTAVGLLALTSRLFPNAFEEPQQLAQIFPSAERRLTYPVGYWNGLATLMAFALPLLLLFTVHARARVVRSLALVPVPALAATVYLTSSRGGSIAAALAVVLFLVLCGRRWAALGAAALAAIGSAGAVAVLLARSELVDNPNTAEQAVSQGRSAALLIGLICVATGLIHAALARVAPYPPRLPRAAAAVFAGLVVAAIALGVVAVHPVHRFQEFKEIPPGLREASVREHLVSGSSNGRWQLWESAVDEFRTRPIEGRGAGSYEAWWAQHGSLPLFVRDAHSLYLETLGELGIVGLVLLLGFFVVALAAGIRRLYEHAGEDRSVVAALLAVLAAFLFEAAVDWMWEFTAVGVVMALVVGLLVGPATAWAPAEGFDIPRPSPARLLRVVAVGLALALALGEAIPLLAQMEIRRSQEAVERSDLSAALTDARGARSLQPWAASPRLQLALVYEAAGELPAALDAIHQAIDRDESDWRLWLVAVRLQTKGGRIQEARQSLARARELNPRSPLFAEG
jgi:O-antigen ligase/polysaccharide polymerase Wzy-like membrane protein